MQALISILVQIQEAKVLLCHVIRRLGNIRLQLLTLPQQRGCIGVSAQSVILRSVDGLDQLFGLLDQCTAPFGFVEQNVVYSTGRSQKVCRRIGVFAQPQGQQLLFEPCDRSVKAPELLRQGLREKNEPLCDRYAQTYSTPWSEPHYPPAARFR